jgi:CDP-diacylglycerol--serine O-phosphatidyltransferase
MNAEIQNQQVEKTESIKRGIYILPNLVTTASLFAGFYSLVSILNKDFNTAAIMIFVSAVCDGLDGKVARMTGTTSKFGVEYDSLADVVAFGVTPGLLVYSWALRPYQELGWVAAFLFVACGALRLARFNVQVNTVESKRFVGLPIPAAACMVASTVLFLQHFKSLPQELFDAPFMFKRLALITLIYLLAFLMVSNFRYYSFKDPSLIRRQPFGFLLLAVVLLIVVVLKPVVMTFAIMLTYVLSGPVGFILTWPRRRRLEKAVHKGHEAVHRDGDL